MDFLGTFDSLIKSLVVALLTTLVISSRKLYFLFIRKTKLGGAFAVFLIEKGLKKRIRKIEINSQEAESSLYRVENLFGSEEISRLFARKNNEKGKNRIRASVCKIIASDKGWQELAQELRMEVRKKHHDRGNTFDREKLDRALREFFEDVCKRILRVAGRNQNDTFKIDGLCQELEKSKYHEWLPNEFSSILHLRQLNELKRIREGLHSFFGYFFRSVSKPIYDQIRGELWWDELLQSAKKLWIYDYLPDPFVFLVSLFVQHAPIASKEFNGLENYYSTVVDFEDFRNRIPEQLRKDNSSEALFKKVWRVCKASWDRRSFAKLIRPADIDLVLAAASIRIVNLATPYPADAAVRRNELKPKLETIYHDDKRDSVPKDVYSLCIAALAQKVRKRNPSGPILIRPFDNIPKEFEYLVAAFKSLLESEVKFISHCIRKVPEVEKDVKNFLRCFREDKVAIDKDDFDEDSTPKWMNIPGPALLAESGLQVLAHIDKSTASSSEIAKRFAQGLIAVLKGTGSEEPGASVERLIEQTNGLRPQLGRVQSIIRLVGKSSEKSDIRLVLSSSEKNELSQRISEYLQNIENMRKDTVRNAVAELYNLRPPDGPLVCFLFGFGGPLWATVKALAGKIKREMPDADQRSSTAKGMQGGKLIILTAPLRPVGEAGDVLIIENFKKELAGETTAQAVLVPDECISEVMKNGVKLHGAVHKPAFCLMGCEAFDDNNVVNSTGCRTIAVLTKDAGVPFYVVTESDKSIDSVKDVRIGEVDSSRFIDGRYSIERAGGRNIWPVAEIVEKLYIKGIITDKGIY